MCYSMLVEGYDLNYLTSLTNRCLKAKVFQTPALNKHKHVSSNLKATVEVNEQNNNLHYNLSRYY